MPLITVTNGTQLFYDAFGDPKHRPLILIEGLTAQMVKWREDFCGLLAAAGFYVIRFDNRDVGLSQKFEGRRYTLADMADDVAGLIEALRLQPCHLVGQSMGGMIAQLLTTTRPELVASLCLIYTTASARWLLPQAANRKVLKDHRGLTRDAAIAEFLEGEYACRSDHELYPQNMEWLHQLAEISYDRDPVKGGNARQTYAVFQAPDRLNAMSTISAPTVILTGNADLLIDPEGSAELHAAIFGSRLRVFPGMGHEIPEALWVDFVQEIKVNAARPRYLG